MELELHSTICFGTINDNEIQYYNFCRLKHVHTYYIPKNIQIFLQEIEIIVVFLKEKRNSKIHKKFKIS